MKVIILGGGFLGILAKWLFPEATVLDWRQVPPRGGFGLSGLRQFGAQYLWRPLPGAAHRTFEVYTTIDGEVAQPERIAAYKIKVGKVEDLKEDNSAQFAAIMRGYAIGGLPGFKSEPVHFDCTPISLDVSTKTVVFRNGKSWHYDVLISTIPLPVILECSGMRARGRAWKEFQFSPICVKTTPIPLDAEPLTEGVVRVNYLTDPKIPVYRTTDRDGLRHYEWLQRDRYDTIPTKTITPGKIYAHWEVEKILPFLEDCDIHCIGRFGCWQPNELAHESFEKLQRIAVKVRAM